MKKSSIKFQPADYVIIEHPTKHFSKVEQTNLPKTIEQRFIILHCIASHQPLGFLDEQGVSAHYLIPTQEKNAKPLNVIKLLDDRYCAWHAGVSRWGDCDNLNDYAIGIEINMPNYANYLNRETDEVNYRYVEPFQEEQIQALVALVKHLQQKYSIPAENVLAHSDVAPYHVNASGVVSLKKTDPGPTLPWRELAKHGIGVWPSEDLFVDNGHLDLKDPSLVQSLLSQAGFSVPLSGKFDRETMFVFNAFRQFHYNDDHIQGIVPEITAKMLQKDGMDLNTYTLLYNLANRNFINADYIYK